MWLFFILLLLTLKIFSLLKHACLHQIGDRQCLFPDGRLQQSTAAGFYLQHAHRDARQKGRIMSGLLRALLSHISQDCRCNKHREDDVNVEAEYKCMQMKYLM